MEHGLKIFLGHALYVFILMRRSIGLMTFAIFLFLIFSTQASEVAQALKFWEDHEQHKAIMILSDYLKDNRQNQLARFNLANMYSELGNYDAAIPLYKKIIKSKSNLRYPAMLYLAHIFFDQGKIRSSQKLVAFMLKQSLPTQLHNATQELFGRIISYDKNNVQYNEHEMVGGKKWNLYAGLFLQYTDNIGRFDDHLSPKVGGFENIYEAGIDFQPFLSEKNEIDLYTFHYYEKGYTSLGYEGNGHQVGINYRHKWTDVYETVINPEYNFDLLEGDPYLGSASIALAQVWHYIEKSYTLKIKQSMINEQSKMYSASGGQVTQASFIHKINNDKYFHYLNFGYTVKHLKDEPLFATSYYSYGGSYALNINSLNPSTHLFLNSWGKEFKLLTLYKSYKNQDPFVQKMRNDFFLKTVVGFYCYMKELAKINVEYQYGLNISSIDVYEFQGHTLSLGVSFDY